VTITEGAPAALSSDVCRVQMITVLGISGDVRWVSPSITALLGWPVERQVTGMAFDLVHLDDRGVLVEAVIAAAGGRAVEVEHRLRTVADDFLTVRSSVQRIFEDDEELVLVVTEAAHAAAPQATQAARYRALIEQSREALVVHADGIILALTPAAGALLGCTVDAAVGREIYSFVAPASLALAKSRRRTAIAGGWPEPEQLSLHAPGGGTMEVEIASYPIIWEERAASQMTLRPMADVIAEAVRLGADAVAASDQAVIITDPGNRIVNWNAGAAALYGWSTLDAIGRVLDELLPWVGCDDDIELVHEALARDGAWQGVAHRLARDGHVVSVRSTTRAVRDGIGSPTAFVSVNEPGADLGPVDQLLTDLAAGLLRDELEVWYQPIVRPETGAIAKVEALVRWRHPERGLLPPAAFLPTVERSPLIMELDSHVLRVACHQVAAWRAGPAPDLEVAVNLSVHDLADDRLATRVADALVASGLPAHALWLEVTETALAHNTDRAVAALRRLRSIGVRLALDDFGTGFAHLVQLRRFPVQAVKIDRVVVTGMATDASDAAIVRSVISLGRELGLTVVAEGVETDAERSKLVELGCDLAQGSLFGTPSPAAELQITGASPSHRDAAGRAERVCDKLVALA
jgi:PAS domain S-box-containing protein